MSDTVKIILIIAISVFFMYRKKVSAFLEKRRTKHISGKDTGKRHTASSDALSAPDTSGDTSKDTSGSPDGIPGQRSPAPYQYEVYTFDYAEYAETGHFADRIAAKLDVIEVVMQNKQHYIKYIPLHTCLLVLVKYRD